MAEPSQTTHCELCDSPTECDRYGRCLEFDPPLASEVMVKVGLAQSIEDAKGQIAQMDMGQRIELFERLRSLINGH